jgi:hypothetical protein
MKALRSVLLASALLWVICGAMFAQNSTVSPDSTRALVQAKTIYFVSGHVKYFMTKGFKTHLVEDSPFEDPSHKELEKWGRFQVVEDAKSADLLVRVYETGTPCTGGRRQHGERRHYFGCGASGLKEDFVVRRQERWAELEHEDSGGRAIQESAGICGSPRERGSHRDAFNGSEHTSARRCEIGTALMCCDRGSIWGKPQLRHEL